MALNFKSTRESCRFIYKDNLRTHGEHFGPSDPKSQIVR